MPLVLAIILAVLWGLFCVSLPIDSVGQLALSTIGGGFIGLFASRY